MFCTMITSDAEVPRGPGEASRVKTTCKVDRGTLLDEDKNVMTVEIGANVEISASKETQDKPLQGQLNKTKADMPAAQTNSREKPRIREMTIDDLPEVFHIGEEVFTAEYSQSLYRTWDEYEITTLFNSDSELCLVAEAGDRILGFALGTTVSKHNSPWKYGYLVWLGVHKNLQKGNVGSRLFKEIRHRMKEQGVRMILIDTSADNEAAIRFFEKQGFGNVRQHVYMTLNLTRKHKKTKKKP